ncbi:hypothetical protein BDB00DRAFT_244804 [Zychaea mexicana]|uniref:uncharacterized protein n=1 Tax=Zychaea mexicana TaxID=64656 RepID=UPI0022FF2E90|nr:uncharacterized protein BDB00DRAFT_244804 [Zychaea mexicana]KAI9495357.1 hypothetical protein BDB00DRAFT_244804 [Zychaea mexicana]
MVSSLCTMEKGTACSLTYIHSVALMSIYSLSRVVPDWTKRLLDQCTEGDLMYNAEPSSSQTPTIVDSQTSTQSLPSSQQKQQPQQQNKRSFQQKHQKKRERPPPDRISTSSSHRSKRMKTSNLKDLPFMRREVDLSVRKRPEKSTKAVAEEATMARIQRSAVNGVPTMKRVGSFIKSAMSPRRKFLDISNKKGSKS